MASLADILSLSIGYVVVNYSLMFNYGLTAGLTDKSRLKFMLIKDVLKK